MSQLSHSSIPDSTVFESSSAFRASEDSVGPLTKTISPLGPSKPKHSTSESLGKRSFSGPSISQEDAGQFSFPKEQSNSNRLHIEEYEDTNQYLQTPDTHRGRGEGLSSSSRTVEDTDSRDQSQPEELKKSVAFSSTASHPKPEAQGSYFNMNSSAITSSARRPEIAPSTNPRGGAVRNLIAEEHNDVTDSSADENTTIIKKGKPGYGTAAAGTGEPEERKADAAETPKRKRGGQSTTTKANTNRKGKAQQQEQQSSGKAKGEKEGWWKSLIDKYGSVELENKGSVARDHLALERTFLAWLRTSLSFASIGVAVTQLFRLNTAISNKTNEGNSSTSSKSSSALIVDQERLNIQRDVSFTDTHRLRQVGKPLGATFLGISILILLLGFHRYFESQHYVIRGKFPASRGSIVLVTFVASALIIASFIVVITVAPSAFEG